MVMRDVLPSLSIIKPHSTVAAAKKPIRITSTRLALARASFLGMKR